ncbi:MAG: hypothetical protein Q8900_02535 [Bacillota bacterium]|nr:hypothetical protein [Bacillota bacterium]
MHIYFDSKYYGSAKVIDLNNSKHKDVRTLEEDSQVESDTTDDNTAFRAPKDKEFAIDKGDFVSLVTDSLKIDNITSTDKANLYELWGTFKEFNKVKSL